MSVRLREIQLLLGCARVDNGANTSLHTQAAGISDWDALLDAADYHGVTPLLYRGLEGAFPSALPPEVAKRLRDAYHDSAKRGLILSVTLLTLLDALQRGGIAALPLKGPVLAELLYPDPALRPFSDVDILIRRQDVPAALRVLARDGYAPGPHLARLPMQTLLGLSDEVLLRHPRGANVDVHWGIAPADYPFRFDPEILWRSLRPAGLGGREVPGLTAESLLLFLCVHGAKHLWSRLMWLGDVARIAQQKPDWAGALELADGAGCARPLLMGLVLAHDLLGAPVPEWVLARGGAQRVIQSLAREAALRLDRIPPGEPGSLELTRFNARMAEKSWAKARHYSALLAPTEAELQLLRLPRMLALLYYPLRIVRLSAKYAVKRVRGR